MSQPLPILAIVVPAFNEALVLAQSVQQLSTQLSQLITARSVHTQSFMVLIDDGSQDTTWSLITAFQQQNSLIKGIKLSRNFGHQAALLCGLLTVANQVDCALSIDADLQDDVNIIPEFIKAFKHGHAVVYGVRARRDRDSFFKKYSALLFYKLMRWLGTPLIINHADYRLLSRAALQQLARFKEHDLFLRGLVPQLGLPATCVYYHRQPRAAGTTKYSLHKMLSFALTALLAQTIAPLRLIHLLGLASLILTSSLLIYFMGNKFLHYSHGLYSVNFLVSLCCMCSIQLISLGFLGEYLGKIYTEVKARPHYITLIDST